MNPKKYVGRRWTNKPQVGPLPVLLLATAVAGKSLTVDVDFPGDKLENRWQFVGKFGFDIGRGTYNISVQTISALPASEADKYLDIEGHLDERWAEALHDGPCSRRKYARHKSVVAVGGAAASSVLRQTIRPHLWYFAVTDCNQTLPADFKARLRIKFLNEGGSHLSVEMAKAPFISLLTLGISAMFLTYFLRRGRVFVRTIGPLHPVIWILGAASATHAASQVCHYFYIVGYSADGVGSVNMETCSEILSAVSRVVHTFLLLLLASGYTLTRSDIGDGRATLPVLVCIAAVEGTLAIWDMGQVEDMHRFTNHDGLKGGVASALHAGVFAWFFKMATATEDKCGAKLRVFMGHLKMASSLYLLSYPVVFIISQLFAPYLRKPILECGLVVSQVSADVWLSNLFLGTRSLYMDVSSLAMSPLPGRSRPAGLAASHSGASSGRSNASAANSGQTLSPSYAAQARKLNFFKDE